MAYVTIPNGDYMNGSTDADYEMADVIQLEVGAIRFTCGLILPRPEIKYVFLIYLFMSNH